MRWLVGLLVVSLLGGGLYLYLREDPLRAELNRRWPATNAVAQRQAAIDSAAAMLAKMPKPNLAAGVDLATIKPTLLGELRKKGVTELTLATERQLVRATVEFDTTLKPEDLPPDSDKRDVVAMLAPRIAGRVDLLLGAGVTIAEFPRRALQIQILPVLNSIRIDKLSLAGSREVAAIADVMAFLLNRYAENLSGAISAHPGLSMTLPDSLQDDFDISGPLKVDLKQAPDLKLAVSSNRIKSPYVVAAATWLVDQGRVVALVQLSTTKAVGTDGKVEGGTFEVFADAFRKRLADTFDISEPPAAVWAAIRKPFLAQSLDSAFAQAEVCLIGTGNIPKEEFERRIPIPDENTVDCTPKNDCTPTRDCTPTCDCGQTENCEQTRECRKCVLGACFNDPVCETEKSLAKGKCEAGKSARKLDCERLKSQKKLTCEGEKSAEKLACEAAKTAKKGLCEGGKETLKRLSRTGNFANIDGNIAGTANLKLCPRSVHFSDALDKLSFTLEAVGSATINTHFKFVPLDAAHILCPMEWTEGKRIDTTIPPQSIPVSVNLLRKSDAEKLSYQASFDAIAIKLHFEPSLLSLVLRSINFTLACPVAAGLLNGLTLGLAPLIPEFAKDYTHRMNGLTFTFAPELPQQTLLGRSTSLKLSETRQALVFSAVP